MHVTELNNDEMYQLKDSLYCDFYYNQDDLLQELTDKQRKHIEDAEFPDDISDEIIYDIYGGYIFSKDDFWCNIF